MYGQKLLQKALGIKYEYIAQLLPVLNLFLSALKRIAIKWKGASRGKALGLYSGERCLIWGAWLTCRNIPMLQIMRALNFFSWIHQEFLPIISPFFKWWGNSVFWNNSLGSEIYPAFKSGWFVGFLVWFGLVLYMASISLNILSFSYRAVAVVQEKKPNCLSATAAYHGWHGEPWNTMTSVDGSQQQKPGWTCRDTAQWRWV